MRVETGPPIERPGQNRPFSRPRGGRAGACFELIRVEFPSDRMTRVTRHIRLRRVGRRRDESGQALVEFAMLTPVMLLVLVGIIKCAIAFNHYVILTDAVRAGARQLAISRGVPSACTNATSRVKSSASDLDSSQITVTENVNGSSSNCGDLSAGNEQGNDAEVSASYPCDLVIFGIDFAPNCKLTSKMTERIE